MNEALDREIGDLRIWLAVETDADKRAEVSTLLARRLRRFGLFRDARDVLEAADRSHPRVARALGLEWFRTGAVAEGLTLYDKGRWKLAEMDRIRRDHPVPFWSGEDLAGKRLLVWAEQGIGDQIMQARGLAALAATAAEISVEVDPRLIPLLQPFLPAVTFYPLLEVPPPALAQQSVDYQTSMLSAWRFLDAPYANPLCLSPDADVTSRYRTAWTHLPHVRNVGISWHSAAPETGADRSIGLRSLRPIARGAANFHSLQYGTWDMAEAATDFGAPLLTDGGLDSNADIARLAGQIAALDLVITIDNATAHLAGSLGVPCWVLLPKGSEWRWGIGAATTPLYPSVRLFRARDRGQWATALWPLFEAFDSWLSR